jgi:hypothetical protein
MDVDLDKLDSGSVPEEKLPKATKVDSRGACFYWKDSQK